MNTVLLKSGELHLPPTPTPLPGIALVAGERRLAHDVTNQLTSLLGNLELLLQRIPYSRETSDICSDMHAALMRIKRITSAAMTSHLPSNISLTDTAEDGVRLFGRYCLEHGITIARQLSQQVPVFASQASLDDVIANLIANAIQAMADSPSKRLTVRVDTVDHLSRLSVSDTGCGMDETTLHRLFHEQFTTKRDGHGIGLLTVFAGVAAMNGDILVSSDVGVGTTFELLFPWGKPAKEAA